MAVIARTGPNEESANMTYAIPQNEPVRTSGYWPEGSTPLDHINGLMI